MKISDPLIELVTNSHVANMIPLVHNEGSEQEQCKIVRRHVDPGHDIAAKAEVISFRTKQKRTRAAVANGFERGTKLFQHLRRQSVLGWIGKDG